MNPPRRAAERIVRIGVFQIDFLGHVCFRFRSPAGRVVLTDPMFAEGFQWEGHRERYLSPPAVKVEAIRECDAVFVSHIHGDHCDVPSLRSIQERTGAAALAPAEVLEALAKAGAAPASLIEAAEGKRTPIGDVALSTFGGYDDSRDARGRPNKFSLLLECGGTRLFYSGDCHQAPPGVRGMSVDAMFCWPHLDDEKLKALCRDVRARTFVVMHCDRFEPGDFLCNLDPDEQKRRVERLVPGIEVIAPERTRTL
jgi:L-ascorbate metabolism protein UlaG (beta-lactamase superfamily)